MGSANRSGNWPVGFGADVQALRSSWDRVWDVEGVKGHTRKIVDLLNGEPEVWIVDETSFPKAGEHSVGVARQYLHTAPWGSTGQLPVGGDPALVECEASCPLGWRLYMPQGVV